MPELIVPGGIVEMTQTELQKAVQSASLERASSPTDAQWMMLEHMDWKQNKPWLVAKILTNAPWNMTPAMALAVTMTAQEEGANPFTNDIYVIEGKIVFSVQFKLKKARLSGMTLGVPKYEFVERDWPMNKFIYTNKSDKAAKKGLQLNKDRGCKCTLPVLAVAGTWDSIEQTCWLSTSHRPSAPWNDDPDHMLKVRAIDYCLRFLGVGISEPIQGDEPEAPVEQQGKISVKK